MAVCIRLSRQGRLHRPFYRVVAIDRRCHREGKANEILGIYDPLLKDKAIQVDAARIEAWVNQGATLSESVRSLLKHHGYALPAAALATPKGPKAAKAAAKTGAKGVKQAWSAPSRRSRLKHAAKVKAARKDEAAKAAPAAPAAEAAAEAPKA